MGKWTKITELLERIPENLLETDDEDRSSASVLIKQQILSRTGSLVTPQVGSMQIDLSRRSLDLADSVELLFELRAKKEALEAALKEAASMVAAAKLIVEDKLKEANLSSVKLPSGLGIRSQPEPVASLDPNMRSEFLDWADANDHRHKLSMNYMTMNKLVKDMLEENLVGFDVDEQGKAVPVGLPPGVKLWFRPKLVKV